VDRVEASERAAPNQVANENQERINQFDPNVCRPISIEGPRCAAMSGRIRVTSFVLVVCIALRWGANFAFASRRFLWESASGLKIKLPTKSST